MLSKQLLNLTRIFLYSEIIFPFHLAIKGNLCKTNEVSKTTGRTIMSLQTAFENPSKEYRGKPFWAWNAKLNAEEAKRQVEV